MTTLLWILLFCYYTSFKWILMSLHFFFLVFSLFIDAFLLFSFGLSSTEMQIENKRETLKRDENRKFINIENKIMDYKINEFLKFLFLQKWREKRKRQNTIKIKNKRIKEEIQDMRVRKRRKKRIEKKRQQGSHQWRAQ